MNKRLLSLIKGSESNWFEVLMTTEPSALAIDKAVQSSSTLLVASDELISALYHPQDSDTIRTQSSLYRDQVSDLQLSLGLGITNDTHGVPVGDIDTDLSQKISSLSMNSENEGEVKKRIKKEQKWFEICYQQIYSAYDTINLHSKSAEGA